MKFEKKSACTGSFFLKKTKIIALKATDRTQKVPII